MSLTNSYTVREQVADRLRAVAAPVFAATCSQEALTVHVSAVAQRRFVKASIREALTNVVEGRVRIIFHTAASLLAPRSLERLVKRIAGDEIVYDPTGSISRAKSLVSAARATRTALGVKAGGIFYSPRMRTLFVALDAKRVGDGEKVKLGELADIERQILGALKVSFAEHIADCPAVRVGFGVPAIELVPVDQRSVTGFAARILKAARQYWKPVAIAAMFGLGAGTAAAKDPAVSQTNLKVTGTGGQTESESAWFVNGSLTAPLGHSWGIQVEGGAGGIDDDTMYGVGGHIFTRDPDSYLLGLFAAYAAEDKWDLDATRVGAEAEIYLNQVSILAQAGYQFSDTLDETAFGEIELRWYLTENFALSGGASFTENSTIGTAGLEWQPGFSALPGLAFRVDGAWGENEFDSVMGGITYYFGANASLKDRHRRQDPDSALFGLFQSVQQEQARLDALYGGGVPN